MFRLSPFTFKYYNGQQTFLVEMLLKSKASYVTRACPLWFLLSHNGVISQSMHSSRQV